MNFSDETLVRSIYRALLSREADPYGLAAYLEQMRTAEPDRALEGMLRHLLGSDEFRSKFAGTEALAELRRRTDLPRMARPFAHAASLGTHCYASWLLKHEGLKRYSLPFDWTFSSLGMVVHCIEDDFRTFLDPAQYVPRPEASRPNPDEGLCDHAFYRDRFGVELVYNHHDPLQAATHAYFSRAVDRFRRLLDSPAPKLFLAVCDVGRIGPEDFPALVELIDQRTTNAKILAIRVLPQSDDARIFGFSPLDRRGEHELLLYQPTSDLLGLQFAQPIDDFLMRRLLGSMEFDLADDLSD